MKAIKAIKVMKAMKAMKAIKPQSLEILQKYFVMNPIQDISCD